MARIAGVDIPHNKRVIISLTYIHGIGPNRAAFLVESAGIALNRRVKDLTDKELGDLKRLIEENYDVEGALRQNVRMNIDRLKYIRAFRGLMHRKGLPVRGQGTKTNARTRKGPKRLAVKKKAKPGKK